MRFKKVKQFFFFFIASISLIGFNSCQKENDIDDIKPNIDLSFAEAFPNNCDTLYFGESFSLKMRFTDNQELGTFSIAIHDNFDHHSHSTELTECTLDPVKEAINAFSYIQDFQIPSGLTDYETNISIDIPLENQEGVFDPGDYHFFISLTDAEGWSTQKGLSIKIQQRENM
jgi:hypothetical protein